MLRQRRFAEQNQPLTAGGPYRPAASAPNSMENRLAMVAQHLAHEWHEHELARRQTDKLFAQILDLLPELTRRLQGAMVECQVPSRGIYHSIDGDRSMGILQLLWHPITFTTRGNIQPLALQRYGKEPVLTGRIVALNLDFNDVAQDWVEIDYGHLLQYEIASLYVPAQRDMPAVLKTHERPDDEIYIPQAEAPSQFLLRTLEQVSTAGIYHERNATSGGQQHGHASSVGS